MIKRQICTAVVEPYYEKGLHMTEARTDEILAAYEDERECDASQDEYLEAQAEYDRARDTLVTVPYHWYSHHPRA